MVQSRLGRRRESTIRNRDSLPAPEVIFLILVGLLGLVPLTGILLCDCLR
jgi:hypothetical protein